MIRHALAIAVLAFPLQAAADESAAVERESHRVALSASVLRAFAAPMAELGGELNHNDKIGFSLTVGVGPGKVNTRQTDGDFEVDEVFCLSTGAQFRYYLFGNFDRGMFAGGEVAYIWLDRSADNTVTPPHEGIWLGPTVGYKHTFGFGMLLSVAFTVGAPLYRPDGLDEDEVPGDPEVGNHPKIGPLLVGPNASVGWAL
jgi:hypothetical protein